MFGDYLKKVRSLRGVSQAELAKMINVSQQTVGSWEVNRTGPSPETIKCIAKVLDVTTDYLLGISENPTTKEQATPDELVIPENLKGVKVAFHNGDVEDLNQEEVDALSSILKAFKAKRKGENN